MKKPENTKYDFSFYKTNFLPAALMVFAFTSVLLLSFLIDLMPEDDNNILRKQEVAVVNFGRSMIACEYAEICECGINLSKCKKDTEIKCAKSVLILNKYDVQGL